MLIKADLQSAWDFISLPENLSKITPPQMDFRITYRSSLDGDKMYPGQIICYKVKPLPFFNASWVTEITQVQEKRFFIDEQRFGPYRFWHHQHIIKEVPEGVEMTDIVSYKLPLGMIGRWFVGWLVRRQLKNIFEYRSRQMDKIFL
ncbi:MAG: SRPBCC family protein [Bacteroidales bacterium]|nr:SRPBCC family protein [Bacteroidales bacterium]